MPEQKPTQPVDGRRCPHSRSSDGKAKLIFDTEGAAQDFADADPDKEGQHPYFCARGERPHWHLTRSDRPEIPGLKRGRLGRRGGNRGHRRGLTRRYKTG